MLTLRWTSLRPGGDWLECSKSKLYNPPTVWYLERQWHNIPLRWDPCWCTWHSESFHCVGETWAHCPGVCLQTLDKYRTENTGCPSDQIAPETRGPSRNLFLLEFEASLAGIIHWQHNYRDWLIKSLKRIWDFISKSGIHGNHGSM